MDTKVKSGAIYAALMPKLTKKAFMLGAVLYWLGCIDTYRDYDISPA